MPVIRKQLKPSDVYPDDIRYNETTDQFESLVNGDWVENPAGDPRKQTTLPPRLTANPACDAAESVRAAFEGQIDGILIAIDNGATVFAIAGTILGLFAFGPFGVFISIALFIADQMLSAGTTALSAALTDPVWDEFVCILFCEMDSQGRLSAVGMDNVVAQVASDIGGLAAAIINSMLNLAGEGGVNNLASLGASTGDCDDCSCVDPCADADSFYAATVNSVTDNGDGTVTVNVSSVDNGAGVQYVGWGDRTDAGSPCCTFLNLEIVGGGAGSLGGALQECGSATEFGVPPVGGSCYHFFLFYNNGGLATPFDANVTFEAACP